MATVRNLAYDGDPIDQRLPKTPSAPAVHQFAITPSAAALERPVRAIFVGGGGVVEIINKEGVTVVMTAPTGAVLDVEATHVLSANTTATLLVGWS